MTRCGKFLAGAAVALMVLTVARADTIETFTHTTTTAAVPFDDSFLLPGFDTSLGTLDGITITLDATGTAEVDVINIVVPTGPQSFTGATATVPVDLTGPGGTSTGVSLVAGPFSGTATPGFNAFPGLPATASNSVAVNPADFGLFEGLGIFVSVDVTGGKGTYTGTANSGVFFGGSASAGAVTTIAYSYMPTSTTVPEPATVGLFGGVLLTIGSFLKKNRQSAKRS